MKLNLGCRGDLRPGYVNVDLYPAHGAAVAGDIRALPFAEGAVEEILAIDVLEHVPYTQTREVLRHWYCLLKPGGRLFIQSPCLELLAKFALRAKTPELKEIALRRIFGVPEDGQMHMTAIDIELMKRYLVYAGFASKPKFETKFGNRTNVRIEVFK